MNNVTTFYIVRHGQSEGNAGFDAGIKKENVSEFGTPLTELGRKQAKAAAEKLKKIHFDAVYSSDLLRAQQTAEIIALERKIAVQTTRMIRERNFSSFTQTFSGKSKEEIREEMRAILSKLDEKAKLAYKHTPDMESAEEAVGRFLTFLREIAVTQPGKTILVVNHGNNIRSLLNHLGYAKFDELPGGSVENTGYIVLESDGIDFFLKETHGVTKQQGAIRTF